MPADKSDVPAAVDKGASTEELIGFAKQRLDILFLSHVDELISEKRTTKQKTVSENTPATSHSAKNPQQPNRDVPKSHANTNENRGVLDDSVADFHNELLILGQPPRSSLSTVSDMAPENSSNSNAQQPATRNENAGGQPFYEQQRKKLQMLLKKRAELETKLVSCCTCPHLLLVALLADSPHYRPNKKKRSTRRRQPTSRTRPLVTS